MGKRSSGSSLLVFMILLLREDLIGWVVKLPFYGFLLLYIHKSFLCSQIKSKRKLKMWMKHFIVSTSGSCNYIYYYCLTFIINMQYAWELEGYIFWPSIQFKFVWSFQYSFFWLRPSSFSLRSFWPVPHLTFSTLKLMY